MCACLTSVFNPNYNPDLTDFAIAKTFMGKDKKEFSRRALKDKYTNAFFIIFMPYFNILGSIVLVH